MQTTATQPATLPVTFYYNGIAVRVKNGEYIIIGYCFLPTYSWLETKKRIDNIYKQAL